MLRRLGLRLVKPCRLQTSAENVPIKVLRRFLSILLMAVIGLPMTAPLFAASSYSASSVPACCRKNGKHHCMGGMEMNSRTDSKTALHAPEGACPYAPAVLAMLHHDTFATVTQTVIMTALQSHDAVIAQSESSLRISRDRSRQKRGPPILS